MFLSKILFKFDNEGLRLPCKSCNKNMVDEDRGVRHFIYTAILVLFFSVNETVVYSELITICTKSVVVFMYFIFGLPMKKFKNKISD
jgi:hypothetical protein